MQINIYSQDGTLKATVSSSSGDQCAKELQGDSTLSLSFEYYAYVALEVNDYVDFCGDRYWLLSQYHPAEKSSVSWKYDVTFYGIESLIKRYLVLEHTDGDANPVFSLTAPALQHVNMIVECLNNATGTEMWTVGEVVSTGNITIDYTGKYCDEGLRELAEGAETEYWFDGTAVNLCKCERGERLNLAYGDGLISLERDVADGVKFYTRLYPIGSSRNIDSEKYGHSRLQLPNGAKYVDLEVEKYGVVDHYEQEAFSGIYPRYTGTISEVRVENRTDDEGTKFKVYFFKDAGLPFDPNDYLLPSEKMRVSFQSGELHGLGETDDHYFEVDYNSETSEFEIINIWTDGEQLPYGNLVPAVGDTFIPWNIGMPDEYYELAELEFQEAVANYNQNHFKDISIYRGTTDHVWIEPDENTGKEEVELFIGRRVRLVSSQYFPVNGYRDSRITKITRRVDLPSLMDIEISDVVTKGGQERINDSIKSVREYAKSIEGTSPDLVKTGDDKKFTDSNVLTALRSAREFISRLHDDIIYGALRFKKQITVDEGITTDNIQSSNYTGDGMFDTGGLWQYLNGKMKIVADQIVCRGKFVVNEIENRIWTYAGGNMIFSAAGSTIFHVEYLDAYNNPLGYTTINSPWLLKKIPLLAGVIAWSRRRQIRRELTPAEREQVVKFRCYEMSDDGTMQTRNWWKIDDIAYCQTLNKVKNKGASSGSYSGSLSNTVYARRVVGIGSKEIAVAEDGKIYDYVDLSVSDCDQTYNDWPAAGDVIVQRGNKTDNERQGFTTIEVTGTQRGVKVYDNVSGYSMEGKRQAFFGYDADTKRAMLEVFGDAYIGARGQQNPHDGSTYLRYNANTGVLELKAVIDAQSTVNNQAITDYINGLITSITDAIQQQVDKKAETWYQSTDPSGAWTDATTKAKHVGDLWYDTGTGKSYYYNSNYQWKYENIPNEVFDTIDGKAAIYVSWGAWGNNLHVRDLYIPSAGYGDYKKDKVYRCTNASTPAFKEVDYSNDDALNNWKANGYADDISGLSTRINSAQSTANGAKSKVDALDAVKGALNGATLVDGGLLLTSLIGLRKKVGDNYVTYGGLNGVWNDSLGGKTIAAWFGGGMSEQDAKILFRMDGSGFMAGNKFLWDEDGNATIGGFTIGTDYIGQNATVADGKGFTYIMRNGQIYVWNNDTSRAALRVNGGVEMLGTSNQPISIGNTSTGGNIHVNAHSLNLNTGATSGSTTTIGNSQSSLKIEANQTTFDNAASFGSTLDVSGLATLAGNIRTGTSLTLPGTTSNPPKLGTFFFCKSISGDMTVYIPSGFKLLKSGDNGEREGSVNIGERSDIIVYMGNMKWVEYWCG